MGATERTHVSFFIDLNLRSTSWHRAKHQVRLILPLIYCFGFGFLFDLFAFAESLFLSRLSSSCFVAAASTTDAGTP
jgi:hypothetical protein